MLVMHEILRYLSGAARGQTHTGRCPCRNLGLIQLSWRVGRDSQPGKPLISRGAAPNGFRVFPLWTRMLLDGGGGDQNLADEREGDTAS